jgi:hypothetical protein
MNLTSSQWFWAITLSILFTEIFFVPSIVQNNKSLWTIPLFFGLVFVTMISSVHVDNKNEEKVF